MGDDKRATRLIALAISKKISTMRTRGANKLRRSNHP
jgi:hypothetical protein